MPVTQNNNDHKMGREKSVTDVVTREVLAIELGKNIQLLHQGFQKAWQIVYGLTDYSERFFRKNHHDTRDTLELSIEVLLEKFNKYESAQQIHDDFVKEYAFWGGYDLALMSDKPLVNNIIEFKCEVDGLKYRVLGLDGKEKFATIPWSELLGFPKNDQELLKNKDRFLSILLQWTSKQGHTFWGYQKGEIKNNAFYEGYLRVLEVMEAHFIETFIRSMSLSAPILPIVQEQEEQKADIDAIANNIVLEYKAHLEKQIFKDVAAFKNEIALKTKVVDEKIKSFNLAYTALVDYTIHQAEKSDTDVEQRIKQLLEEEQALEKHKLTFEQLKQDRAILCELRDSHSDQHIQDIENFLISYKAGFKMPELGPYSQAEFKIDYKTEFEMSEVDLNAFDGCKQKINNLKYIQIKIEQMLRAMYATPEQAKQEQAVGISKTIAEINEKIQNYYKDNRGIFFTSQTVLDTFELLKTSYKILQNSPIVSRSEVFKSELSELGKLYSARTAKTEEIKELGTLLRDKVSQELSREGMVTIREEIASRARDDLILTAIKLDDIQVISPDFLQKRRETQDQAWMSVFVTQAALPLVEKGLVESRVPTAAYVLARLNTYKDSLPKETKPAPIAIKALDTIPAPIAIKPPEEKPVQTEPVVPEEEQPEIITSQNTPPPPIQQPVAHLLPSSPPKQSESLWQRFLHGAKDFFEKVKIFFTQYFNCFRCCRKTKPLDADFPSASFKSSTTVLPFGIVSHPAEMESTKIVKASEVENRDHVTIEYASRLTRS